MKRQRAVLSEDGVESDVSVALRLLLDGRAWRLVRRVRATSARIAGRPTGVASLAFAMRSDYRDGFMVNLRTVVAREAKKIRALRRVVIAREVRWRQAMPS